MSWDNPDKTIETAPMDQTAHKKLQEAVDAYVADFDANAAKGNISAEDAKQKNAMVLYAVVFNAVSCCTESLNGVTFQEVSVAFTEAFNDHQLAAMEIGE